jgi:hypothetical protein
VNRLSRDFLLAQSLEAIGDFDWGERLSRSLAIGLQQVVAAWVNRPAQTLQFHPNGIRIRLAIRLASSVP